MSEAQRLRVVSEDGELVGERGCERCREVQVGDVENLEAANRRLHRQIKELQRNRDAERAVDPERWEIKRLIELWKTETGHTKSRTSADRFDLVKARLKEGYSAEDIELAIVGIGTFRYVTDTGRSREGTPKERHDRLGIALGGGEALERFANLGAEARKGK